ncbi:hypothetical protein Tco_1363990 [Tanacetum coccineum]
MAFPRLQELASAQNSNNLTDTMSIYIERKKNDDLHFAAGLSHLWEILYNMVNKHRLLIADLNVFGGPVALQCAEFLKQLSQTEVLKMLEIRKSVAEVHMQVHKKIDIIWMIPVRLYLLLYYVHGDDEVGTWVAIFVILFRQDPRLKSKKSAMDSSFTLGSTEEVDNVKILQSCNGLLLYCLLDNSPYYSSAGMRIAFDPTKSLHYKLVDAGRTFCDIDIQIYSSETGKWSISKLFEWSGTLFLVCLNDFGSREFAIYKMMIGCSVWMVRYRVHIDDFMTPLPERWSIRSNVWSILLGEMEQDLFLVIKLSRKVVQYNLISKTLHEIHDCGSNQVDDSHDDNDDDANDDDELLQQF